MQKLQLGIAGIGRMGKRHALHILQQTPRAQLVAACTIDESEYIWAKQNFEPLGCKIYKDYDEMINQPGLQAVVVASSTTVHAEQSIKAMKKGLHVLSEKPLSTKLDEAKAVVDTAASLPHLKVMCGFSRRFDASYRDAHAKVQAGLIGTPSILRSQTCDKHDPSGYFVSYSGLSGGIFVDCSIHDIDLTLFFFGEDIVPKALWATGITAVHPELKNYNDCDNAVGVVEFWGGKIAYFYASRMMAHGQEDSTEIIGTKGKLAINKNPQINLVQISDQWGVRNEAPPDYYGRFKEAFVTEINEFTAAVLDDTPVPLRLSGAFKALAIGAALQESLITGKKLEFNEKGERVN
ncbi:hypothetical protein RUND412_008060 [Rhizina undulata]